MLISASAGEAGSLRTECLAADTPDLELNYSDVRLSIGVRKDFVSPAGRHSAAGAALFGHTAATRQYAEGGFPQRPGSALATVSSPAMYERRAAS